MAAGFGIVGFVVAYIVTTRWTGENIALDIGIGTVVAALAWVFIIATGRGTK
jgi:hypothetical protein